MTTIIAKCVRQYGGALIIGTGALGSFAAVAAEPKPQADVIVEAARPTAKVVGRSDIPGRLVRVELRGQVSHSDLDLSIASNAKILKERVHDAARTICSDLDKMYHLQESDDACASRAERAAMPQVDAAIAAAQAKKQ
jgi:UrcA family protein